MVGVGFSRVASAPLKAEPSPFREPDAAALDAQASLVDDAYVWFRGLVTERRALEGARLDAVADGRLFSGRQAVAAGLVDEIGAEPEALAWLREVRGIDPDLGVREAPKPSDGFGLPDLPGAARLEALLLQVAGGPRPMAIMRQSQP
jgi:protease-4